ncbi:MAG TPA: hypothetical protein VFA76_04710 [Terriglobales bacterium]|nr:hypothetical protein [Terriglobales bacterium]
MKQLGISLFLFVLWLSLSAIAQDTGQQSGASDQHKEFDVAPSPFLIWPGTAT